MIRTWLNENTASLISTLTYGCMGHLFILNLIKVHYNLNIFSGLEFSSFKIFHQKIHFFNSFEKVKILKCSAGFELMTYKFVENHLTHCATLLDDNFWKETFIELYLILLFILINSTSHGSVSYHLMLLLFTASSF